ncbi:hypothetical protein [Allochromatium tepidum]|uniref:Quinolinate phosphoribosyl transferase N-terminal domain-containing protein n=1 Tax=Allochromatium tepidum TaxID=553982 RepID=A0ABN6GB50_9GAMM|nr:hypothetical protein [Allochromatium tepidum]BCU07166.1 hypothetical protein Atep_18430 [Allochromatium tepidum]
MYSTDTPVLSDHELQALLAEDVPFGDLTTEALGIAGRAGRLRFEARDPMVVCGTEEAARLFALCGARSELQTPSGREAEPGTPLLTATGSAGALHRAWKSAQTPVEWCSGIAGSAAAIQAAARRGHPDAIVAGTRKAAGGINARNAEDYARAGARLLVTSAPHQAPPRDVQVRFTA